MAMSFYIGLPSTCRMSLTRMQIFEITSTFLAMLTLHSSVSMARSVRLIIRSSHSHVSILVSLHTSLVRHASSRPPKFYQDTTIFSAGDSDARAVLYSLCYCAVGSFEEQFDASDVEVWAGAGKAGGRGEKAGGSGGKASGSGTGREDEDNEDERGVWVLDKASCDVGRDGYKLFIELEDEDVVLSKESLIALFGEQVFVLKPYCKMISILPSEYFFVTIVEADPRERVDRAPSEGDRK